MAPLQQLEKFWPYLLAIYDNSQGFKDEQKEIRGALKLQKLTSYYEVAGVPIPIRFEVIERGQVDKNRVSNLERAIQSGLMKTDSDFFENLSDLDSEKTRHNFYLTFQGRRYVQNQILPALQEGGFEKKLECARKLASEIRYKNSNEIEDFVHKKFATHYPKPFNDRRISAIEQLKNILGKNSQPKDRLIFIATGLADFTIRALENTFNKTEKRGSDNFGKYEILVDAEEMIKSIKQEDYSLAIQYGEAIEIIADKYKILLAYQNPTFEWRGYLAGDEYEWLSKNIERNTLV